CTLRRYSCGFCNGRVTIQRGLYLAELDPIPAAFDHAITPTDVSHLPALIGYHEVAGLVPMAASVLEKRTCGLLGKRPISPHHARTGDAKLSLTPDVHVLAVLVDDTTFEVRAHASDWNGRCFLLRDGELNLVEGANVGLRGTVQVEI